MRKAYAVSHRSMDKVEPRRVCIGNDAHMPYVAADGTTSEKDQVAWLPLPPFHRTTHRILRRRGMGKRNAEVAIDIAREASTVEPARRRASPAIRYA